MNPDDRFALRFGPYASPSVQIGDWLECEVRGPLRVARWGPGRITWPQAK